MQKETYETIGACFSLRVFSLRNLNRCDVLTVNGAKAANNINLLCLQIFQSRGFVGIPCSRVDWGYSSFPDLYGDILRHQIGKLL
jgi:hypothetical protein